MQNNYIPKPKDCVHPDKFTEKGNVVLDLKLAKIQVENCKKIRTEQDQNDFLKNMAEFYMTHNYSHSIDLFTGEVIDDNFGSTALYSMKNMVTNSEMTTLFRNSLWTDEKGNSRTANDVARNVKQSWHKLVTEMEDKTIINEKIKEEKLKPKPKQEDPFDFDF